MKILKIILLSLFCCTTSILIAQKPQEILGIAKENKPASYYKEQSGLWQKEIAKSPKTSFAYWHWYKAERSFLIKTERELWGNDQEAIFAKLKPIVAKAKERVGDSFEYYLMKSVNTKEKGSIKYLQKAYAINPNRKETYESLLIHYVTNFQKEQAAEVSRKMLEQNYYSNANLKWNYNALQTAEENGIFISNGDMDGIPRWVLQYGKGIRNDVLVLSKWLLLYEDYRATIFKKLAIPPFPKVKTDFANQAFFVNALTAHILKNSQRPVYMGCGTPVQFFKDHGLENDMYLVGTAFVYSKNGIDNMTIAKRNFEQKYDLEYLYNNFQVHQEDEMVKTLMNITYIPGLMKLKEHYEERKEMEKVKHYAALMEQIAKESGRAEEIRSWF